LLSEAAKNNIGFKPDYSPKSLKQLEKWYFQLYETKSFQIIGINRESFETCMAIYFGETAFRSENARWIVQRYFLAPDKYELGVEKGSISMMLFRFTDHYREPNNKKRESLFRRYRKYFAANKELDLDKELKVLLRRDKKISAIALYQQRKQCSLAEAKRDIESL
jgi:hypothetical protein